MNGVWGSVHGNRYFWWRIWGTSLKPMGTSRRRPYVCNSASTVELRFGVVRAVGRGIAVLDGGPSRAREKEVFGVFVPHLYNGKCH